MPDTFDRLKQALADRCAVGRELGAGGMATVCGANFDGQVGDGSTNDRTTPALVFGQQ